MILEANHYGTVCYKGMTTAAGGSIVSIGLPGVFVKVMAAENQALAAE